MQAFHRIRQGESLGVIARRHGVTVADIKLANGLHNDSIRAGKSLLIPLSDSVAQAPVSRSPGNPRARVRYQVRSGDSLYKIARKFQVKVADLQRWNSVGRYLQPGQQLTVFVDPAHQAL